MEKRLEELQKRLGKEYIDTIKFINHVHQALDQKAKEHRLLMASNALAGIKVSGELERAFYENIYQTKHLMLDVLERTIEDIEHLGDKSWDKIFKDGVRE